MGDDGKSRDMALVEQSVNALIEHFDSVQIFVTRHADVGTININLGRGNWFARSGQVKDWVQKENERASLSVRGENEE